MGLAAAAVLLVATLAYIFWPEDTPFVQQAASRVDFLRERREMVFANLRDLNFEYKAGKYPADDYAAQRDQLENEAATLVAEIDILERV